MILFQKKYISVDAPQSTSTICEWYCSEVAFWKKKPTKYVFSNLSKSLSCFTLLYIMGVTKNPKPGDNKVAT
jgi:hypothetical protein